MAEVASGVFDILLVTFNTYNMPMNGYQNSETARNISTNVHVSQRERETDEYKMYISLAGNKSKFLL